MTDKCVGVIIAPGALGSTMEKFKEKMPDQLSEKVSGTVRWTVDMVTDPLTGFAESESEIYNKTLEYLEDNDWDYVITVTDLPIYGKEKIVAVDVNKTNKAAIISTPSYGFPPVKKKVERSIISIVKMMDGTYDDTRDRHLFKKFFPTSRLQYTNDNPESSDKRALYYLNNNIRGRLRLMGGMAWTNNPFNMMRSLSGVIAIAFATGSFGLIFSTMWNLSYYFPLWRLAAVSILAVFGMVLWIIVSHSLWESPGDGRRKHIVRLYNSTTVLTLIISLFFYYTVLYLMFLGTGVILLPSSYVEYAIGVDYIGPVFYLELAWFAASLSTVAGAIGAGIQNRDLIRESTYGYRQRFRYERSFKE